jgi:PAS domain S-box-containing protein
MNANPRAIPTKPNSSPPLGRANLFVDLIVYVVLAILYFGAAKLGLSMAFVADQVTVVWPPTGISIAALLVIGLRFWPAVTIGAFLTNITTGAPVSAALGIAAGNTLEALLPVWALRKFFDFHLRFDRLKDAVSFVLIAAAFGTIVSATVGVMSLCLTGVKVWSEYFLLWRVWWLGDAASALVFAPPLIALGSRLKSTWSRRQLVEGVVVCATLFLLSAVIFAGVLGDDISAHPLEYVLFPFVIWAALRLGPPGTAAVVLVASAVAIWGTRIGLGPFSTGLVQESLFLLQAYLVVIATTGLVLSAVIAEWKAAERRRDVEHTVGVVLAHCSKLDVAGPELLKVLGEGGDWDVGALWFLVPESGVLRCQEFWQRPDLTAGEFEQVTRERRFDPGVGLPGRVWSSGQPLWIENTLIDPNFPRAPVAVKAGLHSGFAFPILLAGRVLGVIEFFSQEIRPPDTRLLAMMSAVGSQLGQFIERKRAEEALHTARVQLQIVTDTMSAAVTRCDRDLRYVWVSERYAQWLGRRPDDIAGHPIVDIIGDKGLSTLRPHIERVLNGFPVEYEAFVDFKGPGGRWIHAIYTPTFDETGTADGWVAVVTDVTEHKRIEEALKDASRRKDEFLAMLSHELRNPLAPVRNAAELLRLRGDDPATIAQAREIIDRQVTHMARLLEELLDVSRITRGKISLQREILDVSRLVRVVAVDHRDAFADAGLSFVVHAPETPLWINGDSTRLTQILDNLLGNARKFSDRGGTVSLDVTADKSRKQVILRIRDNGMGIEQDMLPRIFEVFSQADRSLDRNRGGLGLGLAIVKGLVELHQGEVEATSLGSGQGSEFTIFLPMLTEQFATTEPRVACRPPLMTRRKVLIIEDSRDAANSLKELLEIFGHEAVIAFTGSDGVAAARRERPDVIVCDIGLPGMDGFAVARLLREFPETANVRLLAVTGYGQEEDRERAREAGFDGHLVKPADPEKLLELLE